MTKHNSHGSPDKAPVSSAPIDIDLVELMKDIDELTPEQLAEIRARNAHLEDGYQPTSSLFPGI